MSKRTIFLITVAVVLGIACVWVRGLFDKETIEILVQIRPLRSAKVQPGEVPVDPVTFGFARRYQFSEIKVVGVEDERTNKYPHILWHVVADDESAPTKAFTYGMAPKGMKLKIPESPAEPLLPGVAYRIYVKAGKGRGDKQFHTREAVAVSAR